MIGSDVRGKLRVLAYNLSTLDRVVECVFIQRYIEQEGSALIQEERKADNNVGGGSLVNHMQGSFNSKIISQIEDNFQKKLNDLEKRLIDASFQSKPYDPFAVQRPSQPKISNNEIKRKNTKQSRLEV